MRVGDRFQVNSGKNKGKIGMVLEHIAVGNAQTFWAIQFEDCTQSAIEESDLEIIPPE